MSLCLCLELLLPRSSLRSCLQSSIIVAWLSPWFRRVHQFIQCDVLQNTKAQDHSQALSDDCFSVGAKRRKSERRERWGTERVRVEGGKGRTEMLWALMPCQCCMALPLRFPRDMNEVNEWWTQPHETPLFYWDQAVHSRGWVRRRHQQQQQQRQHRRPLLLFLIHMPCVCTQTHTDTMGNFANIPLGTPREGSWEQGWLTKLEGKEAWAGMEKILASRQCKRHNDQAWEAISSLFTKSLLTGSSSVHVLKTRTGNSYSTTLLSALLCCSSWGSPLEVWPWNSDTTGPKVQKLMEHGEYKSNWRGRAIYQAFACKILKVGPVMMLASDWGSDFTN